MIRFTLALALACGISVAAPLDWKDFPGGRRAQLPQPAPSNPGFTLIDPAASGLLFTNVLAPARKLANANLMNGSGAALGDYDGDGNCDIYICDLGGKNRLFRNLGDWKFKDVTAETGTICTNQTSTGAVFVDLNGDRKLDLLVTSMGGPHACFLNLGNGRFTNITAQAGITSRLGATSMALADIDANGILDLYVCNYGVTSILRSGGGLNVDYVNGQPVVRGRYAQRVKIINGLMWELGEPSVLYRHDGKGHFAATSWTNGVFTHASGLALQPNEVPWDQSLSVIFRDINRDGSPDIFTCNDAFTPDRLWLNDGKGNFRALETLKLRTTSHFSMGVDFGDLDRDGHDEFFVVDMLSRKHSMAITQKGNMPPQPYIPGEIDSQWQMRRNTFLISDGAGGFSDIAFFTGTAGSEWSWTPIFIDVDLDGWEDMIISNGFEHNTDDMDSTEAKNSKSASIQEQRKMLVTHFPVLATPNVAFHNKRDFTFDEVGSQWGFNATNVSNGMALADLDNDGDLDVVVNCLNAQSLFYKNNSSAPRIAVRLKGTGLNTEGIGARITVEGGPVTQSQEVMSGGRYVSGDDPMRVFAAGSPTNRLKITVAWPNKTQSVVADAAPGYVYEIDQTKSQPFTRPAPETIKPLFTEVKTGLRHATDGFDDLAAQPSLPFHLNAFGPAAVFADLNNDGFDDLLIGSGRAGGMQLAMNDTKGAFAPAKFDAPAAGGVLLWPKSATEKELLVSLENHAKKGANNIQAFSIAANGAAAASASSSTFNAPGVGGPLALTELNGEMTLFWGARFVAGQYPKAAASRLYRFRNNKWELDNKSDSILAKLGLVSGAVWSDLDSDASPELIVACQWSPIRVFSATDGTLVERTEQLGFTEFSGLWHSVATADIDGDGRMDLIAGNWGLNSFYNQAPDRSAALYFGEFNGPEDVGIFEAYFDADLKKIVPWRDKRVLSAALPWLNEKFKSHADYAKASMDEILAGHAHQSVKAASLASAVFLHRGAKFERHPLPRSAQYAPVFGIAATDFDNDGSTDLFLAQNFFAVREFDSRMDAGRGLLLKGNGKGEFTALSPAQSGVLIYGEQRAAALGDYNQDGRVDILVTQYAQETKVLSNQSGTAGINIRLLGDAKNTAAAGAQFQIGDGSKWGSLQEVQLGGGFWSQNSFSKTVPKTGPKIRIRWPGSKDWAEKDLPAGTKIEIAHP